MLIPHSQDIQLSFLAALIALDSNRVGLLVQYRVIRAFRHGSEHKRDFPAVFCAEFARKRGLEGQSEAMREEGGRDVLEGGDEARERGEKLVAKVPIDVGLQSAVGIADFGDGEGLRAQRR